ncbi:hypothetical protein SERLADRAFT_468573 [Serpula lacrymans var. lacrymans S7.9]|uniref:Uncharacterized protein n=1 Tax=Serpula lacrymans var. lacrymans (strain S7.9) TaxID=578457 RepID=F8NXV9_SERL9|nr:uncharacterized protein SERLADRAFT_468573 [Serpula lacrymans var. lacrymans S7.9]EGO24775.1 hypothetical protein SERLADRAFT_468573 [Serpula lacrymans var. lacrymans S7.9]
MKIKQLEEEPDVGEGEEPSLTHRDDDASSDVWEDIKDPLSSSERGPPSAASSLRSNPSRRRRPFVADTSRRARPIQPTRNKKVKEPIVEQEQLNEALAAGAKCTMYYVRDVIGTAIRLLRRPLSWILFLYLLGLLFSRLSNTLRNAFSPLCILPGMSSTALCRPMDYPDGHSNARWADFPQMMNVQSSTFEQLLDESAGGSALSLEVKKAELATVDLATAVRYSDLKCHDILADSLSAFVQNAKRTARGLTRLNSKVGGAVDDIMAINGYALRTIQDTQANAPSPYSLRALIPIRFGPGTQEVILEVFTDAMETLSRTIARLIVEAEVSLIHLNELQESLHTIHEIVSREDASITAAQSDLLAELWTRLGGNRRALRGMDDRLSLLKDLGSYRQKALAHVVAALQTLHSMSEDMEDLRERVAAPEIVGGRIPLDVHIGSIQSGLERLREGRIKAKEREEKTVRRVLGIGSD